MKASFKGSRLPYCGRGSNSTGRRAFKVFSGVKGETEEYQVNIIDTVDMDTEHGGE